MTAAVSETTLRKKKFAESKLNSKHRDIYTKSPARHQKEFINKVYKQHQAENTPKRPLTKTSYIDIFDDQEDLTESGVDHTKDMAAKRIQAAAKEAYRAAQEVSKHEASPAPVARNTGQDEKILALQTQIRQLQGLIEKFQKVPQNFLAMHPGAEEGLSFELSFMFKNPCFFILRKK